MIKARLYIDTIVTIPSANRKFNILRITGWFHNPSHQESRYIEVFSGDSSIFILKLNIERKDVEHKYGELKYTPGFDQSILMCDVNLWLKFNYDGRSIKPLNQLNPGFRYYLGNIFDKLRKRIIRKSDKLFRKESMQLIQNTGSEVQQRGLKKSKIRSPYFVNLLKEAADKLQYQPKISILIPVYNAEVQWLDMAVKSVIAQDYENWEICIADDASTSKETLAYLRDLSKEKKIKIDFRKKNEQIAVATNTAADLAEGEFILFLDHDDFLEPDALFEFVRLLQKQPDLDVIYADNDKVNSDGFHYDEHYKPDFSYFLLISYNYFAHPVCIRKAVFEKAGKLKKGFEGAQDYELQLRIAELTRRIGHIPKILYHWRCHPGSMAYSVNIKPEVFTSTYKALYDHLTRTSKKAELYKPRFALRLQVPVFQLISPKSIGQVEIVIIARDNFQKIMSCITSIVMKTNYPDFSILIMDDSSNHLEMQQFAEKTSCDSIRFFQTEKTRNKKSFSELMNMVPGISSAPFLLFFDANCEINDPSWLNKMMAYADFNETGVVGVKIISEENKILRAGKTIQSKPYFVPQNLFEGLNTENGSYTMLAEVSLDSLAVSKRCMLTKRELFKKFGGFNQLEFPENYCDADYCLRIRDAGFTTVYCGDAEVMMRGTKIESGSDDLYEISSFSRKYRQVTDPFIIRKLDIHGNIKNPALLNDRYHELLERQLKVLLYSHNLKKEGAPSVLFNIALGLKKRNSYQVIVVSPFDGPLRSELLKEGIESVILSCPEDIKQDDAFNADQLEIISSEFRKTLDAWKPDVALINVLSSFYLIKTTKDAGVAITWLIHESYACNDFRIYLPWFDGKKLREAFRISDLNIFCSDATAGLYHHYLDENPFIVIKNALLTKYNNLDISEKSKTAARIKLGIPDSAFVVLNISTFAAHKNQEALLKTAQIITDTSVSFYCIGALEGTPYTKQMKELAIETKIEHKFHIIDATAAVLDYYLAADIFVFPSLNESYPLVILEAMAFGLPIITTNVNGIREQVMPDVNALYIDPLSPDDIAHKINILLDDFQLRKKMGHNSRLIFECLGNFDEMITSYEDAIQVSWQQHHARIIGKEQGFLIPENLLYNNRP
jgi:glycosyltransferase involved in cell wall biosynthesis